MEVFATIELVTTKDVVITDLYYVIIRKKNLQKRNKTEQEVIFVLNKESLQRFSSSSAVVCKDHP